MIESDTGIVVAFLALGWAVGSLIGHTEIVVGAFAGFLIALVMIAEAIHSR